MKSNQKNKTPNLEDSDSAGLQESAEASLMGGGQMRFAEVQEAVVPFSASTNLEGLNREIVAMLQEDGRAAFSSIANKLGVSEATIRSRVARMKDANLIHFIAVVNPQALGYSAWAMLGIKVAQGVSADKVAEYFRDCAEVVYAMRVASRFDLLAEVVCGGPEELRDFLDQHCYESSMVSSVEPMVGLGLYKSLFKWEKPLVSSGTNKAAKGTPGKGKKEARKPKQA